MRIDWKKIRRGIGKGAVACTYILTSACGSTIHVGKNSETNKSRSDGDEPPVRTEQPVVPGDGPPQGPSAGEYPVAPPPDGDPKISYYEGPCLGAVETLPVDFVTFCENIPAEFANSFKKVVKAICEEKRFVKMFADHCSWNGADDPLTYARPLEKTKISDRSKKTYYYFGASSTTTGGSIDGLADRVVSLNRDSEAFKRRMFRVIPGAKMFEGQGDPFSDKMSYKAELVRNRIKISYDGLLKVVRISDEFVAIFNSAVSSLVKVNKNEQLVLGKALPNGGVRIVSIDEKDVPDLGRHELADETAQWLNRKIMEGYRSNGLLE